MNQFKSYLLYSGIVLLAFIWGLGFRLPNFWSGSTDDSIEIASIGSETEETETAEPPAVEVRQVPFGQGTSPVAVSGTSEGVANPYVQFMKSVPKAPSPQGSLGSTIDSIQSGDIQDQQVMRRNAYFEKLSQELKQLRGDEGPPPPDLEEFQNAQAPADAVGSNAELPATDDLTEEEAPFEQAEPLLDPDDELLDNPFLDPDLMPEEQIDLDAFRVQ